MFRNWYLLHKSELSDESSFGEFDHRLGLHQIQTCGHGIFSGQYLLKYVSEDIQLRCHMIFYKGGRSQKCSEIGIYYTWSSAHSIF